jgi:hypothetical protein
MTAQEIAIIRARIAEIDSILSSGASSSTIDGTTINFDFAQLRTERDELRRKLPNDTTRRRSAFNVNLG